MTQIVEMPDRPMPALATNTGSDSQVMMRLIETAMARPDFDIVKLQELLKVKQQWDANEARKAFVCAMTSFKAEPVDIFKRKAVGYATNDGGFVGYKHAELSDVTDAIGPAMARHQLSFRWDIHQGQGTITVDCIVTHVLGHSEKVTMSGQPDNSGKKNAIQQSASTVTYLQRYTLLAATGMSTKGEDDDGGGGKDQSDDKSNDSGNNPIHKKTGRAEIGEYPAESFEKNRVAWRDLIVSKKKTPAQVISVAETKGRLSENQKLTIDSWAHEQD